ncbi:starch binding domain-containing protein [Hirsutella rhossiliensis]|uniref:Starch binding domain-containing protein n=1 Tax=Hirsutella rhossiliensis TaxID=111463 RepID=A0A9P8SHH2_9HYPO|nr:starch binding domain-containing protein [Hirsutella rhossiliensis]KAH0962836.1 starch binding domain-containing protein [Hirsutella rhossiliensis]
MLLSAILSSSLAVSAIALDVDALARDRINRLQKGYKIDDKNPPASPDGRTLDLNSPPKVNVYIERYIEHSYINTGNTSDTFSISESTATFRDVTDGSSITAQTTRSGSANLGPLSFSISKSTSRSDETSKGAASYKIAIQKREETCDGFHECRFESWTYHVEIVGYCDGSPCKIRAPITREDGNPDTSIIYIPEELPEAQALGANDRRAVSSIRERLQSELARKYCVNWDKPPERDHIERTIDAWRSVTERPLRLLNKSLDVTVSTQKSAQGRGHSSIDSRDSPLTTDQTVLTVGTSTEGWTVGAQTSHSFDLSYNRPSNNPLRDVGGRAGVEISNSIQKSKQITDGKWTSKGFGVSTTCKAGYHCHFEAWAFVIHVSGICRKLDSFPNGKPTDFQRPCQLDIPILNEAGEPHTRLLSISEKVDDGESEESPESEQENPQAGKPSDMNKVPKALGKEGDYCLLDTYEYYRPTDKMYLNWTTDNFEERPNAPDPENLENCKYRVPEEPPATGKQCYDNEIRVGTPTQNNEENGTETATPDTMQVPKLEDIHGDWCVLDNNKLYDPVDDVWWTQEGGPGVKRPEALKPSDEDIKECTERIKAAKRKTRAEYKRVVRDKCILNTGEAYDPKTKKWFAGPSDEGELRSDAEEPLGLEKCLEAIKPNGVEPESGPQAKGGDCKVEFNVLATTVFGDTIKIVGSNDDLKNWKTEEAISLHTAPEDYTPERPLWKGSVSLKPRDEIEYKYIKVKEDGRVEWEKDSNRKFRVPDSCETALVREDKWQ